MVWQARHDNFSRTVSISFHRRGTISQGLGHIVAQLRQLGRSATGAARRRGNDDPLAFDILGERLADQPPAREGPNRLRLLGRFLGRQLVLGCRRFRLHQLQLKLIGQPLLALRALAVKLAPQLLDLQLQMSDQRFITGPICHGVGRLGSGLRRRRRLSLLTGGALRHEHCLGRRKVGRVSGTPVKKATRLAATELLRSQSR